VETTHQQRLLALAGCGSAQGFLFAEPMPAKSVGPFIASNLRPAPCKPAGQARRMTNTSVK